MMRLGQLWKRDVEWVLTNVLELLFRQVRRDLVHANSKARRPVVTKATKEVCLKNLIPVPKLKGGHFVKPEADDEVGIKPVKIPVCNARWLGTAFKWMGGPPPFDRRTKPAS